MQTTTSILGQTGHLDATTPQAGAVVGVLVALGLARVQPLAGLLLLALVVLLLLGLPRKR